MKQIFSPFLLVLFLIGQISAQKCDINTNFSETYELANIILAITPYGKSDPYEVNKKSAYYQEILNYFGKYENHPLIKKANYSRKEWDKYLSFRTDAYGFKFKDNNQLVRINRLKAIDTLKEFDDNMALIEDFVKTTNYRKFFINHKAYYDSLLTIYNKSQMIDEVVKFLTDEFGSLQKDKKYSLVISPLVGRMNCMRMVAGTPTNFITIPDWVIQMKLPSSISRTDFAENIHMLFTEIDHFFVNATTDKYKSMVKTNFNPHKWDFGSGYDIDELSTFNEYMTWAVYDIFVYKYFPDVAKSPCQNWILQNASRGFYASSAFNTKLKQLYDNKAESQTLADLYPAFLEWCGKQQELNSYPVISNCSLKDKELTESTKAHYDITFSEPIQETDTIYVSLGTSKPGFVTIDTVLTKDANNIKWSSNGLNLSFDLTLYNGCTNRLIFNCWGVTKPLYSKKGLTFDSYATIKTKVNVKE